MRQAFCTLTSGNLTNSATTYSPISATDFVASSFTATELNGSQPWPTAGTLENLVVSVLIAPGAGKNWTFTIRINGSDTALTCQIADTALTARDTTHSVSIAAGDRVSLKCVPSGTPTVPGLQGTRIVVEMTGTNTGESAYSHHCSLVFAAAAGTKYAPVFVGGVWYATALEATEVSPIAGTLTALYLLANAAVGASNSFACTLYLNGVAQDGTGGTPNTTATMTSGQTTASSSFSLAVVPGDLLYLECVKVGTNSTALGFGVRLVATTDGQAVFAGGTTTTMNVSATRYLTAAGDGFGWGTTETDTEVAGGVSPFTLSLFRATLSGTPGSGKNYTLSLRSNAASPAGTPSITIADTSTTGSDGSGLLVVADGDLLTIRSVPSGTPTARYARWAAMQTLDLNQTLTGAGAVSTWTVPTVAFAGGSVALVGAAASSRWALPGGFLSSIAPVFGGILDFELNGKGNGWTDVTADVLSTVGITWHRGLPGTGVLDCVADTGTLHFSLNNSATNTASLVGYYSPNHANLRSGFALNIGVRYHIGAILRFTGTLAAIDPMPGTHGPRAVQCEAVDWMDIAARTRLSDLPVQINKRGDEVFQTLIASLAPIAVPDAVAVDTSADIFPYTLDRTRDEQTVLRDEIYRLCVSGLDRSWVRGNGTLVYESRARRASSTTATTQDSFSDADLCAFNATRDRDGVINRVESTVHPRVPSTLTVVMYALNTPTAITAGASLPVVILGPWTDPDNPDRRVGAVTLSSVTATTDYLANTQADGLGADLTGSLTVGVGLSGNATEFTVTLSGSTSGFITKLQQRGKPLYDYGPSVATWSDTASIAQYGLASLPIDMAYQGDPKFGLEAAQYIVYTTATPTTQISGLTRKVPFINGAELARSITREISDRIAITETVTGVSQSFFIQAIDETERVGVLTTEWLLAPADSSAFWLLQVAGRSELDQTTQLGFGLITGV